MENTNDYSSLIASAESFDRRIEELAAEADSFQAQGMLAYRTSQENSLDQARFACETGENEYLAMAKACIANADKRATSKLMEAYAAYGIKEEQ